MKSVSKQFRAILITMILLIGGCGTYKPYMQVEKEQIPANTKAIIVNDSLEAVKQAFTNEGILLQSFIGGYKTEEIHLDNLRKIYYRINKFDGAVKITPKVTMVTLIDINDTGGNNEDTYWDVVYGGTDRRGDVIIQYIYSKIINILDDNGIDYKF